MYLKQLSNVLKYCVLFAAIAVIVLLVISCLLGFSKYAESALQVLLYAALVIVLFLAIKLVYRMIGRSETRMLLVISALSLILRVLFAVFVKTQPGSDFWEMYSAAVKLTQGDLSWLEADYFRLWPYQIPFVIYQAGIYKLFGSMLALKLINCLFMVAINLLIYKLSRLFTSEEASFTASMIYALCPEVVFLTSLLTNQHISLFFILLGLYVIMAGRGPLASLGGGILIGIGNLMRLEAVVVIASVVIVAVIYFLKRPSDRKKELLYAGIAIASYLGIYFLCTMIIRQFGLAPHGISNNCPEWKFVVGLSPNTLGSYDMTHGELLSITDPSYRRGEAVGIISSYFLSFRGFAGFMWRKVQLFYGGPFDFTWALNYLDLTKNKLAGMTLGNAAYLLSVADRVLFTFVSALAGAGCVKALTKKKEPHRLYLVCASVLCLFFVAYMFIEIQPRYRYFILPVLYIMFAYAADSLGLSKK